MKIRRYVGKDTQEAIMKVKMDLGNDAIILNTKKVRQKGLLKMFSKPLVEVLAAVDDEYGGKKSKAAPRQEERMELPVMDNLQKYKSVPREERVSLKEDKMSALENKVNHMEGMLSQIYNQMLTTGLRSEPEKDQSGDNDGYPKYLQIFYDNLVKNEVEHEHARTLADATVERLTREANITDTAAELYKVMVKALGKPETIRLREDGKSTVVTFIGATGAGKTTTLAKIAANYAINHKKSVGLITADTYRIGAVEQLKTYAEILGMPVTVVYSSEEVREAIQAFADKDIVLIDTPGRSYKDKAQYKEILDLIHAAEPDEVFLVMSATTGVWHTREVIGNYSFLTNYKLIFTKTDETPVSGTILNARMITGKNLSYIATGQSVPDDIEIANTDKIIKNLMGSING